MIKELVGFTDFLEEDIKTIGLIPKEGLHIMLSFEEKDEVLIIKTNPSYEVFSKKNKEFSAFLNRCASLSQLSWMVDTNKCFDLPAKGIHSCSPYCVAFKRESILGGVKFNEAKTKMYDRIDAYFDKASRLLNEEDEKKYTDLFRNVLNGQDKMHDFLNNIPEFASLKGTEYIVFYLDRPVEKYKISNEKYLGGKLFNTEEYNVTLSDGQVHGTSSFFNGFNSKKPFLIHQTATFDITTRVSVHDAKALFEFKNLISRRFLPNPLPIFVYEEERKQSIALFKRNVMEGSEKRGYRDIIEDLQKNLKKELGNYYLLFFQFNEIKDFDFVSKFEYTLHDKSRGTNHWTVKNLFKLSDGKEIKNDYFLNNVFDLAWGLFNIVLGDKFKKFDNFFDDIKVENYTENDGGKNDNILLAVRKYRKAIYDFIYKSRRNYLSASAFKEIMISGIKDDLKYGRAYRIKEKLNIFFSLNHHFDFFNINFNGHFMPDKLDNLINKTMLIADSQLRIALDDEVEFAFVSGQMIDFLFSKSKSADNSHAALESFLQKSDIQLFKEEIAKLFNKYKYDIEREDNGRVKRLMREIMGFDQKADVRKLMTFVLAGYFSPSFYFTKKLSTN